MHPNNIQTRNVNIYIVTSPWLPTFPISSIEWRWAIVPRLSRRHTWLRWNTKINSECFIRITSFNVPYCSNGGCMMETATSTRVTEVELGSILQQKFSWFQALLLTGTHSLTHTLCILPYMGKFWNGKRWTNFVNRKLFVFLPVNYVFQFRISFS